MTLQEAISILRIHQQWRLGADISMVEPKELTEAINILLDNTPQVTDEDVPKLGNEDVPKLGYKELTYEERVRWFVNHYYETGMEYRSMYEYMKNKDLDNFVWYGEKVEIPKFYRVKNPYTEEQSLQFLSDQSQELNMGYEGEGPPLPMTFPTIECIGDNVWEELTGGQEVSVNRGDWSFGFGIGYNKAISDLHDISQKRSNK